MLTAPRSLLSVLLSGLYTLIFQNKKGHTLDCRFCCHWDRLESKQALLCHDGLTSQGKRPLNSTVFCVQTIKPRFLGLGLLEQPMDDHTNQPRSAAGRPFQELGKWTIPTIPVFTSGAGFFSLQIYKIIQSSMRITQDVKRSVVHHKLAKKN